MQASYRLGAGNAGCKGASQRTSLLGPVKRDVRPTVLRCKAVSERAQEKTQKTLVSPKIKAILLSALPLLTALPAGANEMQHYLQLATPGLAVVLGSLAYAAASPKAIRKNLFTTEMRPSVEDISLDEILQTEYPPCPGAVPPVPIAIEAATPELEPQAISIPGQTVMAFSEPENALPEVSVRETDAHTPLAADESGVSFLGKNAEELHGRGRMMLTAFAGQQGRTGSLPQGAKKATLSGVKDNSLPQEKGTLQAESTDPVKQAKGLVSHVMEWTGLDARETKRLLSDSNLQGNVVPLHKTGGGAPRELVALTPRQQGESSVSRNGDQASDMATVAVVAQVPSATVAALAEKPQQSAVELESEHKEKMKQLLSQVSSIKAVAVTPVATPAESSQKEYETKMSAIKQSAAQKQRKEEETKSQQRANLEKRMTQATQERLQAVKPYSALATTNKPQGLAKLHPKAIIASFVDTMVSIWRMVVQAAKNMLGQDPPAPSVQGST